MGNYGWSETDKMPGCWWQDCRTFSPGHFLLDIPPPPRQFPVDSFPWTFRLWHMAPVSAHCAITLLWIPIYYTKFISYLDFCSFVNLSAEINQLLLISACSTKWHDTCTGKYRTNSLRSCHTHTQFPDLLSVWHFYHSTLLKLNSLNHC